jgi:hypothetical protein
MTNAFIIFLRYKQLSKFKIGEGKANFLQHGFSKISNFFDPYKSIQKEE